MSATTLSNIRLARNNPEQVFFYGLAAPDHSEHDGSRSRHRIQRNMDDQAPLKITINGQEYDPTEVQELMDKGRATRDIEQKFNTNLEKVYPEYTRTTQTLKESQAEIERLKQENLKFQSAKESTIDTSDDIVRAQEQARKLGIVLKDDTNDFITSDKLDKWYEGRRTQEQQTQKYLEDASALEKKIDGTDGRPAFNQKAVIAYAAIYKSPSLEAAYEEMNDRQLGAWKDAQIEAQKAKSMKTLGNGGDKSPKQPKVNDSNFQEVLREALYGGGQE